MEEKCEVVEIPKELNIVHNGDILNISNSNLLEDKRFLKNFNNNYLEKFEEARKSVFSGLSDLLTAINIKEQLRKEKTWQIVFPIEYDPQKHYIPKIKGSKDIYTCMIKEKGKGEIFKTVKIREIINQDVLNNISKSIQLMAIQKQISDISQQLEILDNKLIEVHEEFYNDRIALIQSGYNLFLQSRLIENQTLKQSIQIQALQNLNQGREALIRSISGKIKLFLEKPEGISMVWESITAHKSLKKKYDDVLLDIQESLIYIIRNTQVITVIFQDIDEIDAMYQAQVRLYELIKLVNKKDFLNRVETWVKKNDDNIIFWGDSIPKLCLELESNFSNSLISDNQQISLDFDTAELILNN